MEPAPPIAMSPKEVLQDIKGMPTWKVTREDGIPKKKES